MSEVPQNNKKIIIAPGCMGCGVCMASSSYFGESRDGMAVVQGAGIIFEHENPKDLADKIIMLISTPAYLKEISDSCHARAKEYDISNMVAGYIGVYKELFKK